MADPTAFYEPEEDELLSSLAVPAYQDHEEEYRRLQELEQHAYAQQIAAAQEAEIEQGLELVPEDVKKVRVRSWPPFTQRPTDRQFLILFHQAFLEHDLATITNMYEQGWNKLTNVSANRIPHLTTGPLLAERMARGGNHWSFGPKRCVHSAAPRAAR